MGIKNENQWPEQEFTLNCHMMRLSNKSVCFLISSGLLNSNCTFTNPERQFPFINIAAAINFVSIHFYSIVITFSPKAGKHKSYRVYNLILGNSKLD